MIDQSRGEGMGYRPVTSNDYKDSMTQLSGVELSNSALIQEQRIARLGDRVLAAILDGVPIIPIFLASGGITAHLMGVEPSANGSFDLRGGPALVSMFMEVATWCAFYFLMEYLFSTTLGKEVMGIEVRSIKGRRCNATEALVRNLVRPIDAIGFYLVGFVVAAVSPSNQRIGDRLAGTEVREKRSARRLPAFIGWLLLNVLLCYAAVSLVELLLKG